MYFKRLEMHGFKSFAEPVVIEFHEGVTCIVGPNGSGKSNISDAIRWVLGEQSPKALRGGRMEEVIFAGTASRKSRGMAEVTLVIDNSTGILNIDYNEVAITRRMYRSGDSEYLINNNQCRLRDIRELIMDTGIGVDGYSLIGQGKIADIVSNKPESRREIFEEAAGVVMYKSKKTEAERKLDSTAANLERVDDIVAEIESRIGGLREDSAKAREYLQLKERYRKLEINITLKNIDSIAEKNEVFKTEIGALTEEIEKLSLRKGETDRIAEADREKSENLERLGSEARDRLLHIVEELNRLTGQKRLDRERLAGIEKDTARIETEISDLEEKLQRERENRSELQKSRAEISEKDSAAREALQEKISVHSRLTREASELAECIDSGRDRLFTLHNDIASKSSEVKSFESIRQTLCRRKTQLSAEQADALSSQTENEQKLEAAEKEYAVTVQNLQHLQQEIERLTGEKNDLHEKSRAMQLRAEELKLTGGRKSARKKTIEEMEHNYEGYHYAVKYIMRAGISGIRGVVAELMNVPSGYETAVETALGGQMQNIICDSEQSAKKAISLLKENRAGRLTFLPSSSVKGSRASVDKRIEQDSGYIGLASDCITCSNEDRHIFDYLLGRVAVTKDMDAAIRLSRIGGGLRFVTLEGEIINAGGAMTGGKFRNRTANLLERRNEISLLEKELKEIAAEMKETLRQAEESAAAAERTEGMLARLFAEQREAELAQVSAEGKIESVRESIRQIGSSNDRFTREMASIDRDEKDAEQTAAALMKEMEQAQAEIETVSIRVDQAMADYETKKQETDRASEEITKTRIAAAEWESKKENMERLLERIMASAEDCAFQIETRKRQQKELTEEKNRILFGTDDAETQTAKLIEEKQNTESCIAEVSAEREAISKRLSEILKEQQSFGGQLNRFQDQKYQLEIRVAKNETQLETLKERLWDEFEISYAQAVDFADPNLVASSSVKESREIRNRIRELGEVNVGAIREYESVCQRHEFLTAQRQDIVTAMEELKNIISEMDATIRTRFKENFDQVVMNFEEIFRELFGGGHAELSMEDENNPLESGIEIVAQPPGKKLQNLNLMSGGEKTMTAIALMFAVLKTKPTPFCILDEVEAALDDANIERFSKYLRKFDNIQFALVTHQKATMEHADVLYGVTMPEQGISKVLSLRLGDDFEL